MADEHVGNIISLPIRLPHKLSMSAQSSYKGASAPLQNALQVILFTYETSLETLMHYTEVH